MNKHSKALVTGASSGIGAVYADRLAKRGYDLILVARDQSRLKQIAQKIQQQYGVQVEVMAVDLSKNEDVISIENRLKSDPQINLLVNNAGISVSGQFLEQDLEQIEKLISLNISALVRLSHAILQRLIPQNAGAIINLGSVVGLAPEFGLTVYGASKSFVEFFSQSLSLELKETNVYIQAVLPSATKTAIWERSGADISQMPPMMDVDQLVDAALIGFDQRETITIPVLKDENLWKTYQNSRLKLLPNFSSSEVALRYQCQ
ncbi:MULTISPECIES: SDR family oxidoreductase [unclassified Acinetobacter]|uniref:SDR family NAD(P)-dependent oxidoreductase n=1 Tax=unclassified Acinetobacter TaxID=196816 RepID=UPI002449CC50|nr:MULTISPECIES: SDR family oxidoreductase [unclassified Acinetobacter]MDH0032215.1 SDR family oxidoreductase [Acinetobacter sp. GD04021]MDH0886010.1 SDR family oxidoreductase [Acinetobacter sp. GD03873]MDH1082630.1 SDR family oxidoreductase [Acinetobacter sp. GD03983]MDH2189575.1 SDR family oxidoreductase [Acinetobacter sp. GD03645]MDH2203594.1 SDR family oxidoreductase [Acinetobacter sp. GD03647]